MEHRAEFQGMTIASKYEYIVYGSVRGLVSEHRTESGAARSLKRDCDGCGRQGGYSDAYILRWTGNHWA